MATAGGELTVTGAGELRVKESDRISVLAAGFRAMGGEVEEFADGFHLHGRSRLTGALPTRSAITGWRWRLPLRGSWPPARPLFAAPKRWMCRTRGSSRRSPHSSVKTDKVYLVGFMGSGQVEPGARARCTPRLACGRHRQPHRGARGPHHRDDLLARGRAVLPQR